MKNSALLRWANNKNAANKNGKKNWLHPAESLQKGHIAYLVKFLGSITVEQPKGMEVVKEASRKLQFSQQIQKAEGIRIPKVELTISVNGVAIHEPKTKHNLHQYPLHRISFCADDKAEKRFFSFIAKESDSDDHTCFIFVSDKLSEEITLTIGQAFDLAYRRFLETSGKELELRRQVATLQNKLKAAEAENELLREQLNNFNGDGPQLLLNASDVSDDLCGESSTDPPSDYPPPNLPPLPPRSNSKIEDLLSDSAPDDETDDSDDFNPRAEAASPVIGTSNEDDFNPRAGETPSPPVMQTPPPLIPPPRPSRPHETNNNGGGVTDIFGNNDDFFCTPTSPPPLKQQSQADDILSQFIEMKAGFSRGLSFGTGDQDFTLDSLDPLKN